MALKLKEQIMKRWEDFQNWRKMARFGHFAKAKVKQTFCTYQKHVKNIGKTSDRLICIYELKMHKRFVEGRKQL